MSTRQARPIKVLHAPLNYANQAYLLSQALRECGVDSHLLRYQWLGNTAVRFYQEEDRVGEISKEDWFGDLLRNVQQVAAEGFDIIHFWNRTLLWRRPKEFFNAMDLPLLRLAGARAAYRFTGYELRRKSLELAVNPFSPYQYGYVSPFDEDDQKRYLDYLAPYIDAFVVQDPEMQTYCPQARIVPRALDLTQFPLAEPIKNERPLVVHAPSRQALKGSQFVMRAVDILKEEGLKFDFLLIENMPNADALQHYRRADIIIDQLLVGWYGVLSMEAMAMGKTVIAYIRDDLTEYFRDGLPLVNANPKTITAALRNAIKDGELRREFGRHGRAFIEKVHDSRVVARTAVELYDEILRQPPATRIVPDLGYYVANSVNLVQTIGAASRAGKLQQTLNQTRRELAALQQDVARDAELQPELPALLEKAEQYDQLRRELGVLRDSTQPCEQVNEELPMLREEVQQYDELTDKVLLWRAKAARFDHFGASRWARLLLRTLGFSLIVDVARNAPLSAPTTARNMTRAELGAAGGSPRDAAAGASGVGASSAATGPAESGSAGRAPSADRTAPAAETNRVGSPIPASKSAPPAAKTNAAAAPHFAAVRKLVAVAGLSVAKPNAAAPDFAALRKITAGVAAATKPDAATAGRVSGPTA